MTRSTVILTLALAAAPTMALAQQASAPTKPSTPAPGASEGAGEGGDEGPDIVVQGAKQPGSVVGDIPPEQQLSPADIRSYGVGSVTELLAELSPQIRSDRGSGGAPVVLIDGKRISGFQEIRDLPTEAIQRVDILPEEVALKYGYRADQKVVNFVLRRRFRAATVELADRLATEGGRNAPQGELDLLKIARSGRLNLHLEYQGANALTENERGIQRTPTPFAIGGNVVGVAGAAIDPALGAATIAGVPGATPSLAAFAGTAGRANTTDVTPYRTLLPQTETFNANATYARTLGKVSATVNATLGTTSSDALLGLPTVALTLPAGNPFSPFANTVEVDRALTGDYLPLAQHGSTVAAHFGTVLNGVIGTWQWSVTGAYDHSEAKTFTDTGLDSSAFQARLTANDPSANPFGAISPGLIGPLPSSRGYSVSNETQVDALLNGSLFKLPAGDVTTSVHLGGDINDFSSRSYRAALTSTGAVSRKTVSGQVNVDVPLTSRGKDVLAAIGSLSVNGNIAVDHLSDFGTLKTIGYGLNWSPVVPLRIIASVTDQDGAPTPQQLGNPQITTPNIAVFDYVLGQNAVVTTLSGGNPNLRASNGHTVKIGATLKPWSSKQLSLSANYVQARVENPIVAFPTATAAIEAAFPDRFVRDAGGVLQRLDTRPINFAETSRSELRWGINFSAPLKSKLQKQIAAWRAGTGPNPFAGLRLPGGLARLAQQNGAPGGAPGAAGAPGGAGPAGGPGGGGPGGGGPGGGGRGFGGGGGRGNAGGRLQFALYHTWHFTDRVLVQQGGPALDLLNGDAIGSSGGQPRHELEGQAGYNNNGLGVRFSANWQSATSVNGGTIGNPQTLRFSDLGTVGVRLFGDLGQRLDLVKAHPWMRGMRVAVSVDNLFDSRQRVTGPDGTTPVAYQPGYLNPLGRTVRLSIRKLFL
ncbi:TonB-dependent receptor [Sphingomonas sp. TREG-RG-20F-R18-01]|uniref:TonB-dependent receptor n=1 Tax=Sphingomonas sp. TREG-RG-20F-R18-01 TaxID=2914982 RepID=UPI001F577005|nr:TonB-dependent receptor [Sphingomonas sp. TREG-RG-20F-R18-01]